MEKFLIVVILAWLSPSNVKANDLQGCYPAPPKIIDASVQLKGDIFSPGYPHTPYPSNMNCDYTIMAPPGFRIKIIFEKLDIDPFDLCMKDSLSIHEGADQRSPIHAIFCGNSTPTDLYSIRNVLHIAFKSDFLVGRTGFHIRYEAGVSFSPCPHGQAMCRNRKCYTFLNKCDGQDNCGDGTDEEKCGKPLPTVKCGVPDIKSFSEDWTDRVVGGKASVPGSWPWQADLQLSYFYPNGHMCGGTLINAQWVLSAAHCFGGPEEWRIHLGNYNKYEKDQYEQVRYVERIILFPGVTGDQIRGQVDMLNDIALMKLAAPVKFTEHVKPACLPSQGQELTSGTKCIASGWGMTRGTGSSNVLKEVEMTIQTAETCNDSIAMPFVEKSMICVLNSEGQQDVCHGDSGGPLVCKSGDQWYVRGATSFGTLTTFESGACALPGARTVFSKVSDKSTWITQMINAYS